MNDFEVKRTNDGAFILLNEREEFIDGTLVKDDGREPVSVWATATTDNGQAFYVKLPVARAMLEHDPLGIEQRLRHFAEMWERGNIEKATT